MSFPNFIVIGAQRAGTTWLHNCLKEHPDIYLPPEKEVHYFDLKYDLGEQWYRKKFEGHTGRMIGEITPNYYQYPKAIERIKSDIPNCKLIFIIREPKSRLVSQFDLFKQTQYKGMSFNQALNLNPVMMDLSEQGKHLKRIMQHFDHKNLLVLKYDKLCAQPMMFLNDIYRFLEVQQGIVPDALNTRVNKVIFPEAQAFLVKYGMNFLLEAIKASPFAESIKRVCSLKLEKKKAPLLKYEQKQILIEDVELIETLIKADLSLWKKAILSDI